MKLKLKYTFIFVIVIAFWFLSAETSRAETIQPTSYLFYLYYDGNVITLDKNHAVPFSISYEPYEAPTEMTESVYRLQLFSNGNSVLQNFSFNPSDYRLDFSVPANSFSRGKIVVAAPFVSDVRSVVFYKDRTLILDLPLASQSTADQISPSPSLSPLPPPTSNVIVGNGQSQPPANQDQDTKMPISSAGGTSSLALVLVMLVVIAIVVLLVWFIIKRKKKKTLND